METEDAFLPLLILVAFFATSTSYDKSSSERKPYKKKSADEGSSSYNDRKPNPVLAVQNPAVLNSVIQSLKMPSSNPIVIQNRSRRTEPKRVAQKPKRPSAPKQKENQVPKFLVR